MEILGIRVDNLSKKEILRKLEEFLNEAKFHQIVTVNPEFILRAQKDQEFRNILSESNLNIADGIGIWYAFIRNFSYLKARFAGADLVHEILYLAYLHNLKVFLAVNKKGLSNFEQIKAVIEHLYPTLEIEGADVEPNQFGNYELPKENFDIVLCNFGAPHQEKFLNRHKNATIRLAVGVGSSLDFLIGSAKRAPKIVRMLGFEWSWRLMLQPFNDYKYFFKRLKRISHSVLVFPIRVIIKK